MIFRLPSTAPGQMVDQVESVKILTGQDTAQDIDMSRKEFIDSLPEETKKQLEELKKKNADAMKTNQVIKNINADILVVLQDFKDAAAAKQAAATALGAGAARADLDAKEAEIKAAKFGEAETLMLKDSALKPDASVLWAQLGQAQMGLKKYDEAEASFKKVLELEAVSKKPSLANQGAANSGLGEINARAGKVPEAQAFYDTAAKVDPTKAAFYLTNEAVILVADGQWRRAECRGRRRHRGRSSKGHGLLPQGPGPFQKATVDATSGKMVLPPGCAEAYQKYLQLDPTGPFAGDVKGILDQAANMKIDTNYKAPKQGKNK